MKERKYREIKKKIYEKIIIVLGGFFGLVFIHHATIPFEPFLGRIVSLLLFVTISIPLMIGGVWITTKNFNEKELRQIIGWILIGMFSVAFLSILNIFYEKSHGTLLIHSTYVVTRMAGIGAMGGFITGKYNIKQRQKHEKLQEKQKNLEKFKRVIDEAPIGIIITETTNESGDNPITYTNKGFQKLTGYTKEEIIGKDCRFLQGKETSEKKKNKISKAIENKKPISIELINYTKTGDKFWNQLHIAPVYDIKEKLIQYVGFQIDITERKEYENRLELFKKAVENAGHGIYITDTEGTIKYINPKFEEITGYNKKEIIGKNPKILNSKKQDKKYYKKLWNTIKSEEIWREEITNKRKNGELYICEQTIAPVPIKENGSTEKKFIAIQNDITQRKLRQQRLEVLHRILRHNLRNELNILLLDIEKISKGLGLEYNDTIKEIKTKIKSLENLSNKAEKVNKTLELFEKSEKTIKINKSLKEVKREIEKRYPTSEIELENKLKNETKVNSSIYLVFKELIENGIKHNDSNKSKVTVKTKSGDNEIKIQVKDNGVGIPKDEKEVLEKGKEKPLLHSAGLGLWSVYWIVKTNGGKISILENSDKGTNIKITLPSKQNKNTFETKNNAK